MLKEEERIISETKKQINIGKGGLSVSQSKFSPVKMCLVFSGIFVMYKEFLLQKVYEKRREEKCVLKSFFWSLFFMPPTNIFGPGQRFSERLEQVYEKEKN